MSPEFFNIMKVMFTSLYYSSDYEKGKREEMKEMAWWPKFGSLGKNGGLPAIVVSKGRKRIFPEEAQ